jgi:predicted nucleotidyltransferase component of viral defense system
VDLKFLDRVKRLAIIAMFSDDDLMETLVLKGGNLLDTIYGIASRASIDLDFSMETEFPEKDLDSIGGKIRRTLTDTFKAEGLTVFDIRFAKRPKKDSARTFEFWGGYQVEFKVIETRRYEEFKDDLEALRRRAVVVGDGQTKTFTIDISKFEYCIAKQEVDLEEGYTIYVYTPEMMVFEKIRAICQQMPEYGEVVPNPGRSARARDFFDIYTILEHFAFDLMTEDNQKLLRCIFDAKRVPLNLISLIGNYREFHRPDFSSVRDTVKAGIELKDFDFYFDYVVEKCKLLKALWEI